METNTTLENLPVFLVQGTNFICRVQLDEFNQKFSLERQMEEAATRVIEQFMNQDKGLFIQCDTVPEIGGAVMVFEENSDPEKGMLLFCHELLANGGYYKESYKVEQQTKETLDKNLATLIETEIKKEEEKNQFKKSIKIKPSTSKNLKKSTRKPRKKKE